MTRRAFGTMPPFLLMHGDRDPLIPIRQSQRMFEALRNAGVACDLYIGAGYAHGFRTPEMEAMTAAFLRQTLSP